MSRYRTASERALEADLASDAFRRQMLEAKAPTTRRLLRMVDEAMRGLGHCPIYFELEGLSWSLSDDLQRGAEHGANSVAKVEAIVKRAREGR